MLVLYVSKHETLVTTEEHEDHFTKIWFRTRKREDYVRELGTSVRFFMEDKV